ncbi:MAG: hypothetical protein NZO16_03565 [Deltaproteobacteria bacterium]|nr:hypothetical protein [Deltaproteobacteria bacterium]
MAVKFNYDRNMDRTAQTMADILGKLGFPNQANKKGICSQLKAVEVDPSIPIDLTKLCGHDISTNAPLHELIILVIKISRVVSKALEGTQGAAAHIVILGGSFLRQALVDKLENPNDIDITVIVNTGDETELQADKRDGDFENVSLSEVETALSAKITPAIAEYLRSLKPSDLCGNVNGSPGNFSRLLTETPMDLNVYTSPLAESYRHCTDPLILGNPIAICCSTFTSGEIRTHIIFSTDSNARAQFDRYVSVKRGS